MVNTIALLNDFRKGCMFRDLQSADGDINRRSLNMHLQMGT